MSQDASTLLLPHHLKALKLPTFLRDYTSFAATCSAASGANSRAVKRVRSMFLVRDS